MPEYSTPKLTPDETTKLPGMNGSSSGYVLTSELLDIIRNTFGQANGVATLDGSGKLPTAQLPDIADDVLVYASKALLPAQGVEAKIYITTDDNVLYRWDATLGDYVQLSVDLSDYATLDDLAAEESARETADTNLNNALTAIDHRLDNLEQPKCGYIVSNYKDGAITPSGKGAWSIVEGLRGVSRVENQLVDIDSWTTYQIGKTVSDDTITMTAGNMGNTSDSSIYLPIPMTPNHNGLLSFSVKPSVALTGFAYMITDVNSAPVNQANISIGANVSMTFTHVFTTGVNASNQKLYIYFDRTSSHANSTMDVKGCITSDLNIYFNTTDLSFLGATDSAKLATIQQNYPHLLTPSDYGTRIVDSSYSGVRAWAKNLVDIPTTTWASDGSKTFSIDIPIGTYTLSMTSSQARAWIAYLRDSDGEITQASSASSASGRQSVTFTLTRKATTLVVYVNGATVMSDVQIEEGSTATAYTPYHAPSTLSLTFTGKSAGSVYDSCEPNVEVGGVARKRETQRIGTYTFTGNETWNFYPSPDNRFFFGGLSDVIKKIPVTELGNVLLEGFTPQTADRQYSQHNEYSVATDNYGKVFVYVASWVGKTTEEVASLMAGKTFNYELADPVVTLSDPLIDNTLLTESGGRMATVQTGTVVDGSFDMGFITL